MVAKDRDLLRMLTEATVRGHPPGILIHTGILFHARLTCILIRLASQQHPSTSLCGSDRKVSTAPESLLSNIDPERKVRNTCPCV